VLVAVGLGIAFYAQGFINGLTGTGK